MINHVGAVGGEPPFGNRQATENNGVIVWRATRATMWARATLFTKQTSHLGVARVGAHFPTESAGVALWRSPAHEITGDQT